MRHTYAPYDLSVLVCPYDGCDFYTKKNSTLSMHLSIKHNNNKYTHYCTFCDEGFPSKSLLSHHTINHHGSADITCKHPSCNKKFKHDSNHKIHFVRKHMKKEDLFYKMKNGLCCCLTCNKLFTVNAVYYHVSQCSPMSPFTTNLQNVKKQEINENKENSENTNTNKPISNPASDKIDDINEPTYDPDSDKIDFLLEELCNSLFSNSEDELASFCLPCKSL